MSDKDSINPSHYRQGPACPHCGNVVECITVTRHMSFSLGNAIKYREGFMQDQWKVYPNDARYEVSTSGACRNVLTGHIRKPVKIKNGYATYMFSSPRKLRYAHAMVLETFVSLRPKGFTASHLDGNRQNNNICNLKWESLKDNSCRKKEHGTELLGEARWSSKISRQAALQIKNSNKKDKELSRLFGLSVGQVRRIRSGDNWAASLGGTFDAIN